MRRELNVRALKALDARPSELDDTRPEPASASWVQAALAELRRGRPVLVVDDEDREDEGDLIIARSAPRRRGRCHSSCLRGQLRADASTSCACR